MTTDFPTQLPEYRGATPAEVGKQLGLHTCRLIESGLTTVEIVGIVLSTDDGYIGSIGKLELLSQGAFRSAPETVKKLCALLGEERPGPGYVPIVTINRVEDTWAIHWVGPFPNAPGGEA